MGKVDWPWLRVLVAVFEEAAYADSAKDCADPWIFEKNPAFLGSVPAF